jgi:transposase
MVNIEDLVPQDHLLRKIIEPSIFRLSRISADRSIVKTMVAPALIPVMLLKMLLVGYLYGIRSERRH